MVIYLAAAEGGIAVEPRLLFWALFNFLIFAFLLWKLFWKPMVGLIESRREEIQQNLARAEQARDEAERIARDYQARVSRAESEAREVLQRASRAAEETGERILAEARQEADRLLERAREAMEREKQKALAELRTQVAELAVLAAARVVGKTMTLDDHRRLAEEAVERLER